MKTFVKKLLRRAGFELHRFSVEQSENGRFIRMLKYHNVNLIFDVGANTGQFGLLLRDFGFDGEIVSFEPLSDARIGLLKNSKNDRFWKVAPQAAIGEQNGEIEIQIAGNSEALFLSKSSKDFVPNTFVLHSAFPNPFNPSTQISYYLSRETHVDISVFDIAGRLTETLVNDLKDRGSHAIIWNASNQSSGVYFIKITADNFSDAQKVILTK